MTKLKIYAIIIIEKEREVNKMLEIALFELKKFYKSTEKNYSDRNDDFAQGYLFGLRVAVRIVERLIRMRGIGNDRG